MSGKDFLVDLPFVCYYDIHSTNWVNYVTCLLIVFNCTYEKNVLREGKA